MKFKFFYEKSQGLYDFTGNRGVCALFAIYKSKAVYHSDKAIRI